MIMFDSVTPVILANNYIAIRYSDSHISQIVKIVFVNLFVWIVVEFK